MRLLLLLMLFLPSCYRVDQKKSVVAQRLDEEEPAPLLTSDYGIVRDSDRKKNMRSGVPFLPAPEQNYFYWQCLKLDKVGIECLGVERAGAGMGCRRYSCIPDVEVVSGRERYSFVGDKGWCLEDYRDFKERLRHLLRRQGIACFGGEYLGEVPPEKSSEIRNSSWALKNVKTRLGSWAYFRDR